MNKNIKTALIIGGIILVIVVVFPLVFGLISGRGGLRIRDDGPRDDGWIRLVVVYANTYDSLLGTGHLGSGGLGSRPK